MDNRKPDTSINPPPLPRILDAPPAAGKVLVLSPHADDETIGLGGTIVLHREQKDPVDVLFLTSGITGNADGRYAPDEYIEIRRQEARAACGLLGVDKIEFWEYPDNFQVTENDMAVIVPRLVQLIEQGGYEVLYTPHRGEVHTDHHVSAVLASRALERITRPVRLIGYEIWAPLGEADVVVNVTRVYPKKLEAAACYQSQLALSDFIRLFKSLNGYRSVVLEGRGEYAEAFQYLGG
ncbi:MAG: PIG-L deacetylase family protein [Planctomycetota bacterium]